MGKKNTYKKHYLKKNKKINKKSLHTFTKKYTTKSNKGQQYDLILGRNKNSLYHLLFFLTLTKVLSAIKGLLNRL